MLLFIPVLIGVLFIVFTIEHFSPSDPVYSIMGLNITPEQYQAEYEKLGLDRPFFVQFFDYIGKLVTRFDLGVSYSNKRPVMAQILERCPATLKLGGISILITIALGLPFGIISATKQYSAVDYTVTVGALFFASMPNFWLGLMMVIIFALKLGWLPATGVATWRNWVLPCLTLGLSPIATVARMTRSSMLDVIRQDYIRTAHSKGITESRVIWKHALKNALIPVITIIGFMASMILAGSVVIEAIFGIPGLGMLMMTAINNADSPLIMGTVLFISVSVCVINLLIDIIYGFVDPRIKAQYYTGSGRKNRALAASVKSERAGE